MPGVHDAGDDVDDLERLLDHAHIAPPEVLVGHSYGGLLARLFAHAHPDATAGLVLVDAMGRNGTRRQLAVWPRDEERNVRRVRATPVRDGVDIAAGEALADRITTLGDTPLVVITAGAETGWARTSPRTARALGRLWMTMQDELAGLSSDSLHAVALHSDHFIQGRDGQPDVVIRAVREVVAAVRDGRPLKPCPAVFGGAGVRCRGR